MTKKPARRGFTIIEILIVIAVIGILAGVALKAVNPAKRLKQARDSQRKTDITTIANALVNYAQIMDGYPSERTCDTSRGAGGPNPTYCPPASPPPPTKPSWTSGQTSWLYQELTKTQLKVIPVDPINDTTYYYKYEPAASGSSCVSGTLCTRYWIGARLEDTDPGKEGKMVFRCSDYSGKSGCEEVEFQYATGSNSFDDVSATE